MTPFTATTEMLTKMIPVLSEKTKGKYRPVVEFLMYVAVIATVTPAFVMLVSGFPRLLTYWENVYISTNSFLNRTFLSMMPVPIFLAIVFGYVSIVYSAIRQITKSIKQSRYLEYAFYILTAGVASGIIVHGLSFPTANTLDALKEMTFSLETLLGITGIVIYCGFWWYVCKKK